MIMIGADTLVASSYHKRSSVAPNLRFEHCLLGFEKFLGLLRLLICLVGLNFLFEDLLLSNILCLELR